ncbi:triple tyrosine motif-containing protein [Clostridium sp. DJ247]|uniref:triple tyrosine motif-containing protein n=1 Tax=Clostridium sp. DJ247 TaxID=2726188 RepID=UPI00162A425D|nr:triple tyrosine motif-containing protein [Clostridium sp. DJ247]MBC2582883.1 triple tyrosine motif-containing protein [Clostridium sp. DJ247]
MNGLDIICNLESPQEKNSKIVINVENNLEENLLYKYIIGYNGTWNTIRDFSEETQIEWMPGEDGRYIIMVQAKKINGERSFDYVSKIDYIIGRVENKLIDSINLDKNTLNLGEKLNLCVNTNKVPLMFRYWLRVKDEWKIIKEYSADNTISWVVKSTGKGQILVECKNIDSKNKFDDFQTIEFEVLPLKNVEITDFKCLTKDIIEDSELVFKVEASYEENRTILYKFIKIDPDGKIECIQDYSTKKIISYTEKQSGNYRLLCLVKDMYSTNSFDDRAVINFKVKKYKEIFIKNFTADLNSPQLCEAGVTFKADVVGGKELFYRFIIDGNHSEDSGYTRRNTYLWKSKAPGEYSITLWVKDKSYDGNYEAKDCINFTIDEKSREPVKINELLVDKKDSVLCNEKVRVKINASGGIDLRYSFIIKKNNKQLDQVNYGVCNWIDFIPKEQGQYQLEARVKDKYSAREFDCHSIINIDVFKCIPAHIDYILLSLREKYIVGDTITLNTVIRNTSNVVVKYILNINGHRVEESDYVDEKSYMFTPKYGGIYTVEILAKNKESDKIFDSKKEIRVEVMEAMPVTNTKIKCDKVKFLCNEAISFSTTSEGGKDIIYEFYMMEKEDWNLVQNYSKKNYYTFIPFCKDEYRVLVLAKSQYSKVSYEDYDIFTFSVE